MPAASSGAGPGTRPPRFHELDSLRGLAALTVVFGHLLLLTSSGVRQVFHQSPLRVIVDSHQAVVLFFVLSGFVLTLPFIRHFSLDYTRFLVKRTCRIYLPYLAALLFSIAADHVLPRYVTENAWINYTWTKPVTGALVAQHVLFLGNYDSAQFNTAFWSLIHEMRISLVFPLIAMSVLRTRTVVSLFVAVSLSLVSFPLKHLLASGFHVSPSAAAQSMISLHYAAFFILGALLARSLHHIDAWYGRQGPAALCVLAFLVLLFYGFSVPPSPMGRIPPDLYDWLIALGAIGLIVFAVNCVPFQRFLTTRFVHHLGTVSYSLYLVHGTILFALIHTCYGHVPMPAFIAFYLTGTLLVTEIFYRLVERPAMLLGHRLTTPQPARQILPDPQVET